MMSDMRIILAVVCAASFFRHAISFDDQYVSELLKTWDTVYGLSETTPPDEVSVTPDPAPHLQLCQRLNRKRMEFEKYELDGRLPRWARGEGLDTSSSPPWIRGDDSSNVPHTRFVQSELWKRQFPSSCKDQSLKFALFKWAPAMGFGLGSALHLFSLQLASAVNDGRILVPYRRSFLPALHEGCKGSDYGSLNCYFFPLTSAECEDEAHSLWEWNKSDRIIFLPDDVDGKYNAAAMGLDKPWATSPITIEIFGRLLTLLPQDASLSYGLPKETTLEYIKTEWWHAQAIRFLLRWPTPKLCHVINKVRHEVYGLDTARAIVDAKIDQEIDRNLAINAGTVDAEAFEEMGRRQGPVPTLDSEIWWQEDEPFVPRPILSLHVMRSEGDGGSDYSLASYIWHAERIRKHVPSMSSVWLTSEIQVAIEEAKLFKGWKFYFSKQISATPNAIITDTSNPNVHKATEASFADMIISSQCNYFAGALKSNWSQLINGLRLTNGRLKAGILSVNLPLP